MSNSQCLIQVGKHPPVEKIVGRTTLCLIPPMTIHTPLLLLRLLPQTTNHLTGMGVLLLRTKHQLESLLPLSIRGSTAECRRPISSLLDWSGGQIAIMSPVRTLPAFPVFPVSPRDQDPSGADAARTVTLEMVSHVKVRSIFRVQYKMFKQFGGQYYLVCFSFAVLMLPVTSPI